MAIQVSITCQIESPAHIRNIARIPLRCWATPYEISLPPAVNVHHIPLRYKVSP